jgi:Putative transmembrane protein (PGPGW)
MRESIRIVSGLALIGIGLILAIPFVPGPGVPLVIAGLVILSPHFRWARRLVDWAKRKFERVRAT